MKKMRLRRHHLGRHLAILVAILVLAIPTLTAPMPATACSNPGCSTSSSGTTLLESFFSPLSVSVNSTVCNEFALSGQRDITVPCFVTYTLHDPRGNNEGFLVLVATSGFTNSLAVDTVTGAPVVIPPSDISLTSSNATLTNCFGLRAPITTCEIPRPITTSVGMVIPGTPPGLPILVGCPTQEVGEGVYAGTITSTVHLPLGTPENEVFGKYPLSWSGTFTITVQEGPAVPFVSTFGCSAANSA